MSQQKLIIMIGYGRMHNYKSKVAGLVIAAVGLVLWLVQYYTQFTVIAKFSSRQHNFMFWWITLFGLYLAAFSREKNDDERVKAIRAKSMLVGFNLVIAVLLSLSLASWLTTDLSFDYSSLIIIPTFCIIFYLLFFHVGLYFDNLWDYSDQDEHPFKARKKDKTQLRYIIFLSIIAILLGLAIYEKLMK